MPSSSVAAQDDIQNGPVIDCFDGPRGSVPAGAGIGPTPSPSLPPAWSTFLERIDRPERTSAEKSRDVLRLLRACDGQGGPPEYEGRVVTLKTPVDLPPLPVTPDVLVEVLGTRRGALESTRPTLLPEGAGDETAIGRWASSGGGERARVFTDPLLDAWMGRLFEVVHDRLGFALSHTDLFHGHVLRDDGVHPPDILVVFHAQEYPRDLDCGTQSRHDLATGRGLGASFETGTPPYWRRNLILSVREGRLWQVDTSPGTGFNHLVRSDLYDSGVVPNDLVVRANTVQEGCLGTPICDVNYFPGQFGHPFLTGT